MSVPSSFVSHALQYFLVAGMMLFAGCQPLSDQKATELIRLKYRQQSTTPGEGKWMVDSIAVERVITVGKDSFAVKARVTGMYQLPVLEGTPGSPYKVFNDSVRFLALKSGTVWITKRWELFQSD